MSASASLDEPNTPVLEDVDFHVPAGAKLGILGETGAGKSTLVNLISRFYDPTEGSVLIDGVDARDRSPHFARKSASSRKTRSRFPTPSAATSASAWANSANTMNSTFAAWPPSPVRTASSAACRKATIPWLESVASAFPAAKNSA